MPIPINAPPARWKRRNTLIAITIYTASGIISFAVIAILYNILR